MCDCGFWQKKAVVKEFLLHLAGWSVFWGVVVSVRKTNTVLKVKGKIAERSIQSRKTWTMIFQTFFISFEKRSEDDWLWVKGASNVSERRSTVLSLCVPNLLDILCDSAGLPTRANGTQMVVRCFRCPPSSFSYLIVVSLSFIPFPSEKNRTR